jgi:hypothetical protein
MPEAGVLVQNTEHIRELYTGNDEYLRRQPVFAKVVNSKIDMNDTANPTVQFQTKKYYNESLRLSVNPREYLYKAVNPIESFFPENHEYIAAKQQQEVIDSRVDVILVDEEIRELGPASAAQYRVGVTDMNLYSGKEQ